MSGYVQAAGGVLIAAVLILSIQGRGKELAALLSIFVCSCLGCLALGYLEPILSFLQELETVAGLDPDLLGLLLKVVGTALIGELAASTCNDSGNAAMGKALQYLTGAVILWLSLPMLTALLTLMETILKQL